MPRRIFMGRSSVLVGGRGETFSFPVCVSDDLLSALSRIVEKFLRLLVGRGQDRVGQPHIPYPGI
jgi:hypothetical protein